MPQNASWKKLNAWHLKLIMAILMALNHLEFVYGLIPPGLQVFFVIISRCVAPVFAYLLVEGILHTRSLGKYCLRLWVWAAIVWVGNELLGWVLTSLAPPLPPDEQLYLTVRTNVAITLAAGVLFVALIIWGKQKKGGLRYLFYVLSAASFVLGFISEWGIVLLPFIAVTYFLREKKGWKYFGYAIVELIAILFNSEIFYFLAFPFIALYNGKRGPANKFSKYLFYVFYPVHLWLIAIINFILLTQ